MKALLAALALAGASLAGAAPFSVPVERFQLPNGLRVIVSPDPAVPVVSVYLIYDVGSRSEEKGRTGFAHLFEHMMFQGSANVTRGQHFATVEANGGSLNGSTHPDYTDYFETLPSNKLATALWLESDRMRGLAITEASLNNQKEAVKEERRLRMDNQPYVAAIVETWPTIAFRNWGSSHSLIGSFEDLNAATVDDVAKFFKTYYAPNNAVLALAGNVTAAEARKLVEAYFGDIPRQPPPKRPDLAEPPGVQPRTEVVQDRLARVPAVILGFPGPVRRSPDYFALAMVDAILTAGDSSRLKLNLVKGKQSVVQYEADLGFPFSSAQDYKDPGMYAMMLRHQPKFTAAEIVDQAQEEIAKLQNEPMPSAELERVRTVLRAGRVRGMQTSLMRAQLLAQYELFDGHAELINGDLERMLAATPAQIQAVAKKYLAPDRRTVLHIVPSPQPPAAKKEAK